MQNNYLYWFECFPGINCKGQDCNVGITASCHVEDAIARQRQSVKDAGGDPNDYSRDELLADFMDLHWAFLGLPTQYQPDGDKGESR